MQKRISRIITAVLVLIMTCSMAVSAQTIYEVKENDVLWKVAKEYDTDWQTLSDYNQLDNSNLIYVGQKINIPDQKDQIDQIDQKDQIDQIDQIDLIDPIHPIEKEITILGTSDLHGRIYSYEYAIDSVDKDAGLAKIQTLVKEQRATNDNVILMDMGDSVQDNSAELFNKDDIHPMIKALNYMSYDVWELGNHEFNFEKSFLENNIKTFKGDVLAANVYKEDNTRFVKGATIIEKDGVRVAVVGLLPPYINVWESSAPEHFEGLTFTSTVEEAKKVIKELDGKYDVLVGAFHIGKDGEHGYEGAEAVANACPEFDVIFMGHAHSKVNDVEVNGVKLIEPGKYGWALAKASIKVEKEEGKYIVKDVKTENLETNDVEEDAEMLEAFKYVHEKSINDANKVVGKITKDYIEKVDYITGDKKVSTMPTAQIEDTALIDLINEVQTFYSKADVSSAAAFKNDMNLLAGDFKKKDVANIYKYPNTLMGVNISGANLKAYMEWSVSYYNTHKAGDVTISFDENVRGYNYDMFSGVTYDIDLSKPAGERITNLLLAGKEIENDAVYKLAVNNYRFGTLMSLNLVTEADKYYDSYNEMQDAGRIRDLIIKYIQEEKDGIAEPVVDNNWKIIGADLDNPLKEKVFEMIKSNEIEIPSSEDGRTPNVKSINVNELIEQGKISE